MYTGTFRVLFLEKILKKENFIVLSEFLRWILKTYVNKFGAKSSKVHNKCPEEFFAENHKFWKKTMISIMLLDSEWKIETIGGNFLARLSKLHEWRPKETFFGKRWFHNFSQTLREKISSFQANILAGWPKLFCIVREGVSEKRSFAKHWQFHDCFLILGGSFFHCVTKIYRQGSQNYFPHVQRYILRKDKYFWENIFYLFSDRRRSSLGHLATNFWQGLQICSLRLQRNILMKNRVFLREKFFSEDISDFVEKFLGFQQKTIGTFAQITFQMSRGTLSAKKSAKK